MISICRQFRFEAAHHLLHHEGKCKNVHGHSYLLEVEVTGPFHVKGPSQGMILDFGDLKKLIDEHILSRIDHADLNMIWQNPTAENMVDTLASWIQEIFNIDARFDGVVLVCLSLWETQNSCAVWRNE